MIDLSAWKSIGEGIGVGGGGLVAAIVAAAFGVPALRDGLRQLRELVERMESALDSLREGLHGIDKRLTAVEVQNTLMMGLHHPESLEQVIDGAEQVIAAREGQRAAGHPFRRVGDHAPDPEKPTI